MLNNQNLHFYICHASFKDRKSGHDFNQDIRLDFSIPTNKITKSFLRDFTKRIENDAQAKYPEMDIHDVKINSISYMGYMTEQEFNS
ncbi:hypothetical protein MJ012_00925 [Acinetobacter baumannii]|uniref:hypothetical protein n=1 Tax=Acinetobacter calcoaceticus/baumannii complex TaxID=909768 RepID=UPI001660AEC9|nr:MULTISPECIES: hypothetical protein [Acinetobacter calcoaceticus/baumannii complex]EKU9949487.1 hypothetical protein [Acinetobacter baumannii]EKX8606168.1 hypothetical protein [Acinetobacter baumannii]EKX8608213.1 hypothetical protein [Acinetobacter baumannii]MBD0448900.1 hypothetical protein [Acinetobacter baumannii]MCZ3069539.1 hypothetical protein [Acinetobacter baumannii]